MFLLLGTLGSCCQPRVGTGRREGSFFPEFRKVYESIPSRGLTYPPDKAYLKMIFLFPRWDMLISRRVVKLLMISETKQQLGIKLIQKSSVSNSLLFSSTFLCRFLSYRLPVTNLTPVIGLLPIKGDFTLQPMLFRGKLAVGFRQGNTYHHNHTIWPNGIIYHQHRFP